MRLAALRTRIAQLAGRLPPAEDGPPLSRIYLPCNGRGGAVERGPGTYRLPGTRTDLILFDSAKQSIADLPGSKASRCAP